MVIPAAVWPILSFGGGLLSSILGGKGKSRRIPNIWDAKMGEGGSEMRDLARLGLKGGSTPVSIGGQNLSLPNWGGSTRSQTLAMLNSLREQGQQAQGSNWADALGGAAQGIGMFGAGGGFGGGSAGGMTLGAGDTPPGGFVNSSDPNDTGGLSLNFGGQKIAPQEGLQFQAARPGAGGGGGASSIDPRILEAIVASLGAPR